ncbi:hypothetical protein O3W52_23205 [Ensifer psoraleae]|uniref:Uncharacterized protein n=2 Tax=Sinorhizobium/Ensifer group TaxID=227292 RepID=A0ABT4KM30_9HYPH|nr:hypothetical protein [Sinorhizobium psoraleae]
MSKHLLLLATVTAAIVATTEGAVRAGPLSDAATKAEQQATSGDAAGARETLRQAVGDFSQTLPFAIGKAVFVTAEPAGYAM